MKNKIHEFKNWLKASDIKAQYFYNIKRFIKDTNINSIEEINENLINSYIIKISDTLKKGTVNNYIKSIKKFLEFLKIDIELPKERKPKIAIPKTITLDYLYKEILPTIDIHFPEYNKLKYKTIILFLFFSGARKSELLSIYRKDFNLENNSVKIINNKANEEKIVVFPDELKKWIIEYFKYEPERYNAFNLKPNTINKICKKINKNLDINFNPHILRKSFATYYLNNGMDAIMVMKMGGWKNIKTLEHYRNTDIENIKEVVNRINNLNKKRG